MCTLAAIAVFFGAVIMAIMAVPARFHASGSVIDGRFSGRFELRHLGIVRFGIGEDGVAEISVLGIRKVIRPGGGESGSTPSGQDPFLNRLLRFAESKGGVERLAEDLYKPVGRFFAGLLGMMRIELKFAGEWNADDPELMGELCGFQYAMSGIVPCLWDVRPCWESEKPFYRFEGEAGGRIVLGLAVAGAIRLAADRNVRDLLRYVMLRSATP